MATKISGAAAGIKTAGDRLAEKSTMFAGVDLAGKLVALAVVVVLARKQSPATFGLTVTGLAASAIVQVIVDGGQGVLLARAVLTDAQRARIIVSARFAVAIAVSLLALTAILAPFNWLPIAAAAIVVGSSSAVLSVPALVAGHRLTRAALALVGPNVLYLVILVILPVVSATAALLLFAASNFGMALVSILGRPELTPHLLRPRRVISTYRDGAAAAVFNLAASAYGKIDTVLVAVLVTPAVAGVYSTLYRVVLAAVGLTSWVSPLAARHLSPATSRPFYLRTLLTQLTVLSVLLAGVLMVLGAPITAAITHGGKSSLAVAIFLSLLVIPTMLSAPLSYWLLMHNLDGTRAKVALIVMSVAFVLYPIAISLAGAAGAAFASLAVEILCLVLFVYYVRRNAPLQATVGQHSRAVVEIN